MDDGGITRSGVQDGRIDMFDGIIKGYKIDPRVQTQPDIPIPVPEKTPDITVLQSLPFRKVFYDQPLFIDQIEAIRIGTDDHIFLVDPHRTGEILAGVDARALDRKRVYTVTRQDE